jgi:hypothetical protein
MSTVCQSNKEKKRNTHLRVKEACQNIVSSLSYYRNAVSLAFSPRLKVAGSRCSAEGGGLGSPLAGFLPNTEINFLMISTKLLDICPVSLLIFSPIKIADFLYYSSCQMMAILCCVAKKAAAAAHVQYTVYTEGTRSHQLRKVTLRCHTNSVH